MGKIALNIISKSKFSYEHIPFMNENMHEEFLSFYLLRPSTSRHSTVAILQVPWQGDKFNVPYKVNIPQLKFWFVLVKYFHLFQKHLK